MTGSAKGAGRGEGEGEGVCPGPMISGSERESNGSVERAERFKQSKQVRAGTNQGPSGRNGEVRKRKRRNATVSNEQLERCRRPRALTLNRRRCAGAVVAQAGRWWMGAREGAS